MSEIEILKQVVEKLDMLERINIGLFLVGFGIMIFMLCLINHWRNKK